MPTEPSAPPSQCDRNPRGFLIPEEGQNGWIVGAVDADLANADLEIALVPVDDEETGIDSYALLYRFAWPY